MFERRQRAASGLGFSHVQRSLQHGEKIPSLPGLSDQLRACRYEMARSRRDEVESEQETGIYQIGEDYDEDD